MIVQKTLRVLKGTCGIPLTYRSVLICAVCFCAFAFVVMFEYTFEYKRTSLTLLNTSTQSNLVTAKRINAIRFVTETDKKSYKIQLAEQSKPLPPSRIVIPPEMKVPPKPENIQKDHIKSVEEPVKVVTIDVKPKYAVTLERGYLIENPDLCSSVEDLSVLIIIHTAPGNFLRRMNIRSTYGNFTFFKSLGNFRVLFLLGKVKVPSVEDKILAEFEQYGDILQGDFVDAYRNLTHKGVMAYKWIKERCRNAKVILKADDDVIVNTYKLFTEILPVFKTRSKRILCNHILPGTMLIIRDKKSKWYVNENEFKGQKFYPRYCSGFFVMITNDVIPSIYQSAYSTPFFWVDDVYLYGLLPSKVDGIKYFGLKAGAFNLSPVPALKCYRNASRVCDYLITGASKPEHVAEIWKHMSTQYYSKLEALKAVSTLEPKDVQTTATVVDRARLLKQRIRSKIHALRQLTSNGNNGLPVHNNAINALVPSLS